MKLLALAALLVLVIGVAALGAAVLGSGAGTPAPGVSPAAATDIPPAMLALYTRAATYAHTTLGCPALDWALLAAIGKIETDHGGSRLPGVTTGAISAGAGGPMQFLQPTFDAVTTAHPPPPGGAHPLQPARRHPHRNRLPLRLRPD